MCASPPAPTSSPAAVAAAPTASCAAIEPLLILERGWRLLTPFSAGCYSTDGICKACTFQSICHNRRCHSEPHFRIRKICRTLFSECNSDERMLSGCRVMARTRGRRYWARENGWCCRQRAPALPASHALSALHTPSELVSDRIAAAPVRDDHWRRAAIGVAVGVRQGYLHVRNRVVLPPLLQQLLQLDQCRLVVPALTLCSATAAECQSKHMNACAPASLLLLSSSPFSFASAAW